MLCVNTEPVVLRVTSKRLCYGKLMALFFCYPQAVLLGQTNRLKEALSILKGLVLDDPHNLGHYKTLAGMYAQNGQFNDVSCCLFENVV